MGCGISKEQKQKLENYTQKIEELNEVNGQLAQQIAELKDLKNKRKPIYVVADQEIDDLYVFKTDLDKRFEKIENQIEKIQESLNIQPQQQQKKRRTKLKEFENAQDEEQWLKMMMEDNELTVKPFNDAQLDDLSEQLKEQEEQQKQMNKEDGLPNILADAFSDGKIELNEQTIPKEVENQQAKNHEIQQSIAEALGDDMKDIHEGIKSKLFKQTDGHSIQQQQFDSNSQVVINQIQFEISQKSDQQQLDLKNSNINTERIQKTKRGSVNSNSNNNTQQHFYAKQQSQIKKKGNKKYAVS